jgi:hypothetical protein
MTTGIPRPQLHIFQENPMMLPAPRPLKDYRVIAPENTTRAPTYMASTPIAEQLSLSQGSRPALIDAAANCKIPDLELLIKQGKDINVADNNGDTALAWAARRNCAVAAKILLQAGIKPNTIARNGFTPRDWAVWAKSSKVVELLPKG